MIERHVTSLGMAKKLREKGWDIVTAFQHCIHLPSSDNHLLFKSDGISYHPECDTRINAPLISELLEELTNNEIMDYTNKMEKTTQGEFMNIFRNPDRLAEMWLEAKGEK